MLISPDVVAGPWTNLEVKLENSWNDRYISLMQGCCRHDLRHHLLEEDRDDFDGNGIVDRCRGPDLELSYARDCFS